MLIYVSTWKLLRRYAIAAGSCGCSSLPLVRPNLAGGVEAQTGVNGACANPSYILTYVRILLEPLVVLFSLQNLLREVSTRQQQGFVSGKCSDGGQYL